MPTVLVIDDDPLVATSIKDAVPGWTVLEAYDGASGLDLVRTHRAAIDLIVLDMVMPHEGILTCVQIRTEAPQIPVLPFTAAYERVATATELGCVPAILKPATPDQLAQALYRALELTPPVLPMSPLITYMHDKATKSEQEVRVQKQAALRVVILGSSELICAGLRDAIGAAGGSVRACSTSAAILHNGLTALRVSLIVADSDVATPAIELASTFRLPLLIVARIITAAYRIDDTVAGVVVEPVSSSTMAEALLAVSNGQSYRDKLLETIFNQTELTKTERIVARMILQGLNDNEIAEELIQKPSSVRTHKANIYSKLNIGSVEEFIAWADSIRIRG